jgi:hypothetical protein
MNLSHRFSPFVLALALGGFSGVHAANFHPIARIGTNMTDGNSGGNPLSNIIQGPGVGFGANEPHAGPSATWYTDAPGGFPSDYVAAHAGPEYLWFDLGAEVDPGFGEAVLAEISYWGYSTNNANGVREFNLSFATDAEGGAAGLGDESYGTSITANPSFAALIDNVTRQSFSFSPVIARYVRVEVTSTHITNGGNGPPAGGDRVGVGEFAFEEMVFSPDPNVLVPSDVALDLTTSIDVFDIPISNAGNSELTISGVNFIGPNAAAFSAPSFPSSIAALGSDIIEVQFDPAGLLGPVSGTLQIMSNDPDTPTAEIVFTGAVPPTEQDIIVPGAVDRGSLVGIDVFDFAVRNGGGSDLTINSTSFTGPDAEAFSVLNFPVTIPSLSTETFQIQIDPSGHDGPISATLQIASNDPDTPNAEVEITARALGNIDQFYPISAVEVSTSANDLWPVSNLIQGPGVGFDDNQPHGRILGGAGGNWVTGACGFPCDYIETTGKPVLIFDLGVDVSLCEISVWGYSATNSNGVSEFSLRFATETDGPGGFGTSVGFNPTYAGLGSGELPNDDDISRASFLFEQGVIARYVEFTCEDNHFIAPGTGAGGEIPGGDRVGIGEIAFEITTCETPTLFFEVEADGDHLVLTWESQNGQLYNVRSESDPSRGDPVSWAIYNGHADIGATPPLNTLIIPRPADPLHLFVIEAFPIPPVVIFADGFEGGAVGWTFGSDGAAGTAWELGTPAVGVGPGAANSPTNSFGTNLNSRYEINANVWLRSPVLDLSTASDATLVYSQFVDIEEGFDSGTVSVLDSANNLLAEIATQVDGLTGAWQEVRLALPPAALGQMIKIEFRLQSDDFVDPTTYAGFYIDDVQVTVR